MRQLQQNMHILKEERPVNHWECTQYSGNVLQHGWKDYVTSVAPRAT